MDRAACKGADPGAFFPERGESQKPGKRFCKRCEVFGECDLYRRNTRSAYGMWAGRIVPRKTPGADGATAGIVGA